MANRHHEVLSHKHVDLAELDRLGLVDVAGRSQDDEQRPVVSLYLGPLVGLDGVLHGQRVQPELLGDRGKLLLGGLVEPDPCQPVLFAAGLVGLLEGRGVYCPATVHVDGAVHDHIDIIRPA